MNVNEHEGRETREATAALFLLVVESWAFVIETFLHRRFGRCYMESRAGWGFCVLLGFILCWEEHEIGPLVWLGVSYFVLNLIHRAGCAWRQFRGELIHSGYTGWPHLHFLAPTLDERHVKLWVEPPLAMFAGSLICAANQPLGVFILIGGFILFGKNKNEHDRDWQRVVAINDSLIESRLATERFRGVAGFAN